MAHSFTVTIVGTRTPDTIADPITILEALGFADVAMLDAPESVNFQATYPMTDTYRSMRSFDSLLDAYSTFRNFAGIDNLTLKVEP